MSGRSAEEVGAAGMPVPWAHAPPPAALFARTRTRYAAPLLRNMTSCEAAVPVWFASTHSIVASEPTAASSSTERLDV